MQIGVKGRRGFIALPKLKELVKDIEAIRTGDFILLDD
jgi:hypothetical protein